MHCLNHGVCACSYFTLYTVFLSPDNNLLVSDPMQTKMKIEFIPQHILLSQTLTLNLLTIVWWPVAFQFFPETAKDVHMHSDISSQLYNNSTLVSLEVVYKK